MQVQVSLKIELAATAGLSEGEVQSFARERKVVHYRKKQRGSGEGCDESENKSEKPNGRG